MDRLVSSWHIGIAAEAFAAAQFARYGINVSVQYGANQPEYDLIASKGDTLLKVSVKGSQDGGWGLTQNYKKSSCSYHEAIDAWLKNHGKKTIFCLVQFQNIKDDELPLIYLATPAEIAKTMKESRNGMGDTVLRVCHKWSGKAQAAGSVDRIPDEWLMSKTRVEHFFK